MDEGNLALLQVGRDGLEGERHLPTEEGDDLVLFDHALGQGQGAAGITAVVAEAQPDRMAGQAAAGVDVGHPGLGGVDHRDEGVTDRAGLLADAPEPQLGSGPAGGRSGRCGGGGPRGLGGPASCRGLGSRRLLAPDPPPPDEPAGRAPVAPEDPAGDPAPPAGADTEAPAPSEAPSTPVVAAAGVPLSPVATPSPAPLSADGTESPGLTAEAAAPSSRNASELARSISWSLSVTIRSPSRPEPPTPPRRRRSGPVAPFCVSSESPPGLNRSPYVRRSSRALSMAAGPARSVRHSSSGWSVEHSGAGRPGGGDGKGPSDEEGKARATPRRSTPPPARRSSTC